MIPYFFKTPEWMIRWFPSMTWKRNAGSKTIFLTFDDGPIPNITPYVLNTLEKHHAKATFFCVGDNVQKHPEVFREAIESKHTFGNHTFHHVNGWNTPTDIYWEDVIQCEKAMNDQGVFTKYFRPPHGRMRKAQRKRIETKYEIMMWSHLSGDFDSGLNFSQSISAMKKAPNGSILVFHDSLKAEKNLKLILPDVLSYFSDEGYEFKSL